MNEKEQKTIQAILKALEDGAILIPANVKGEMQRIGDTVSLKEAQDAVGGYVENVPLPDSGPQMLVNEEGLLERLELNPRATLFAQGLGYNQILVGDALLLVGSAKWK